MDSFSVFADLTAEIEIPREGTLSRVLYRDDRIRVVGFAFDVGQELTEHTATRAAVIQVVSGRLSLTLGTESIELGPTGWVHMALPPRSSPSSRR